MAHHPTPAAAAPSEAARSNGSADASSHTWPSAAARAALFGAGSEQVEEVEAVVTGTIPAWCQGSLVMNGGGDYSNMRHLFDGHGLLSKFRVDGAAGRVWGSQRFLDTKAYRAYRAQGRVVYNEFATPPDSLLGYLQQMLAPAARLLTSRVTPMTDNACVSVYAVGPGAAAAAAKTRNIDNGSSNDSSSSSSTAADGVSLLALTEDQFGNYFVDPQTLKTLHQVQFKDGVPAIMQSPHPAIMADGNLINFSRTFPFGGSTLWRQDRSTLQRQQIAFIPDRHALTPAWMHDFAAAERHVLLLEQPLYMNFLAMLAGWDLDAVWMHWQPQEGCRLHLVTLDGSKPVQTFICPTFAFVHIGNAFESADGSTLHVDLGVFDDASILNDLKLQALRAGPEAAAAARARPLAACEYMRLDVRLTGQPGGANWIRGPRPLIAEAASKDVDFVDFPTIHPAVKGKSYRYAYTSCAVRPTNIGNALAKLDLQTGEVQVWHGPGGVVGEPHLIPRPQSAAEDDGIVLSACVDSAGRAFLLVMDAGSWTELARAQLPYSTPYRFHGVWLPPQV